jgi:hypothetical protein
MKFIIPPKVATIIFILTTLTSCEIKSSVAAPLNELASTVAGNIKFQYFGMHIHHANSGTVWPKIPFGSWRLWDAGVMWSGLQPARNQWNFSLLDKYVALAELKGVDILLPLALSPEWASARPSEKSPYGPGKAAEPAQISDWRTYVRTVAQRYKGRIHNFEIWNEPNEKTFFSGSTEKLIELTCAAKQELKTVDPTNNLVSPSMVGNNDDTPKHLASFLQNGGNNCVDIIGYHYYLAKSAPEDISLLVEKVKAAMNTAGVATLPMWNTETGWWIANADGTPETDSSSWTYRISEAQSASWVARSLIVGRAAGLARFYYYAWDNNSFGLIEPSTGSLKPGAVAYGIVANWLAGITSVQCSTDQTQWRCVIVGDASVNDNEIIVWDAAQNSRFAIPPGKSVLSVDHLDGTTDAVLTVAKLRSIPVTNLPVRVTLQ